MFRKGGKVDSRGTGITSGLDDRQNYEKGGEVMKRYGEILGEIQAQRPKMSLGDWLRIAATGARIAGAPGRGGGIADAFTAAAEPIAELGGALAQSQDVREASESKLAGTLLGAELEQQLAEQKVTNMLKDKSYNRIADEKSTLYTEEGTGHQKSYAQGYGYADAERNIHGISTLPYGSSFQEGKTVYTDMPMAAGEVYFDPEAQEYVVYEYNSSGQLVEARSFPRGDANREQAKKFAEGINREPPTIKKSSDSSDTNKKTTADLSSENPFNVTGA